MHVKLGPDCGNPEQYKAWAAATGETLRVLEGKWKIYILNQLFSVQHPLRFSELERMIDGITQKMLIQQLKQLESDGIVKRTLFPQVPPRVEYELTEIGHGLAPAMIALVEWAEMRRAHGRAKVQAQDA